MVNPTNNQIKNKSNISNNKSKDYLNVKINLSQKSQNKILDEIKKTITSNNIVFKVKKSSNLSNEKKNNNNNIQSITRNRIKSGKYNSKTITNNLFNHQKGSSQNSNNININININNSNKIIFNKIIDVSNKNIGAKNRGNLFFLLFFR